MGNANNDEYTIEILEKEAKTKIRTIRFYISEGLLEAPNGNGPNARYNGEHLLRLQVIDHLKKKLKLSEIKEILSNKTLDLQSVLAEAEAGRITWDTATLKKMVNPGVTSETISTPRNFSFATIGINKPSTDLFCKRSRPPEPEHEEWKRYRPVDGIEINIRADVNIKTRELAMQLINQLRE